MGVIVGTPGTVLVTIVSRIYREMRETIFNAYNITFRYCINKFGLRTSTVVEQPVSCKESKVLVG